MREIFISYAKEDSARARAIKCALEAQGYAIAMDCDIPPGERYRDWIEGHLSAAAAALVLWSRVAVRKDWVLDEATEVRRASKPLIPIIIDDLDIDDVPHGFRQLQYLRCNWLGDEPSAETARALGAALEAHLSSDGPLRQALEQLERELVEELGSDYEILEKLGTGRLTLVHKARNKAGGGLAAISVTPLAGIVLFPGFLAHFRRGVEVAQSLKHKYILEVRDLLFRGNVACTIMEYVDGHSLSTLIDKGPLELERVQQIAARLVEGLTFAHSRGVVHANLSSTSIIVDTDNRPVISDFVVAQVRGGRDVTMTNSVLFADPRYLSPEQCRGEAISFYSDQYALGVILFEMLTGKVPFAGGSPFSIMQRQCEAEPPRVGSLRPDCPPSIERTVARLLAKDPLERFPSNQRLLKEINRWLIEEPASSVGPRSHSPEKAVERARQSYRRCRDAFPDFLSEFYDKLLGDPRMKKHFRGVFVDKLAEKLSHGIDLLLDLGRAPNLDERTRNKLERIAAVHRPLQLAKEDYDVFSKILVELAIDKDPAAKDEEERELLRNDWQNSVADGVRRFMALCERGAAPAS